MKCLILAAGYATRLYPLTENFPKPLLKVGEKTILDWLVDDVSPAIDEFIVVSNHKFAHHFEAWAAAKPQKITVVDDGTSTNETRLGAVKDIALGLAENTDDVLVMAGDNVLDFSLLSFVDFFKAKQASCVRKTASKSSARLPSLPLMRTSASPPMRRSPSSPGAIMPCRPSICTVPAM